MQQKDESAEIVHFSFVPAPDDSFREAYYGPSAPARYEQIAFWKAAELCRRELGLSFNLETKAWIAFL